MNEDLNDIENQIQHIKTEQDVKTDSVTNSDKVDENQCTITEANLPKSVEENNTYVKAIGKLDTNDFYVKIDKNKDYRQQAEDMAEAAAVIAATQSEEVREEMIHSTGEQLVEKTKAKAAKARAEHTEAATSEQKAKSDLYQSLLETFGAYKHHPEWLRKIIVGLFTIPYLILLFCIGIPTGIIKFTIECIDGIFVRYDNVEDKRKAKVRFSTWFLLGASVLAAIILPILKYYNII